MNISCEKQICSCLCAEGRRGDVSSTKMSSCYLCIRKLVGWRGWPRGSPVVHQQGFDTPVVPAGLSKEEERKKLVECGATDASAADVESTNHLIKADKDWKWFDGNLDEYYDKLEQDEHTKRKPDVITSYAVHRWMGPERSTLEHYKIIRSAIYESVLGELSSQSAGASTTSIRVLWMQAVAWVQV